MPNQNTTSVTVESVKDTDLIVISNDQVLTSSLTVAEYFEKQHRDILEKIRMLSAEISADLTNSDYNPVFIETVGKDSQGKDRPVFLMNRDGFTEVVGNLNGIKARAWKRKYFAAFNRMEATLRKQQQEKPMDLTDQLMLQAKLNVEIRDRLNAQDQRMDKQDKRLDQQAADIKRLQQAHNGITLRHEMKNNDQQRQIDQNTENIASLQKSMFELLQEKSDITQDLDIFVKSIVNTYDKYQSLSSRERYQTAWNDFYKAIAEEAGKPNSDGYVMSLVNRRRRELVKGGVSETTAKKNVTGKIIVNSYPELRNAAIVIMTRMTEDIKNHEMERAQG